MKTFEHFGFSGDRRSLVKRRVAKLGQFTLVLLILATWFSISNHCVLGALQNPNSAITHASCHGDAPAPSEPAEGSDQSPCCKILRATLPTFSKNVAAYDASIVALQPCFVRLICFPDEFQRSRLLEFDTGPPFAGSFAESVLQRSILAHAPPIFLS